MSFSLIDAGGVSLAVLSYGLVLILPGAALANLFGAVDFRETPAGQKPVTQNLPGIEARNRLLANHVDDVVVTADDPVWNNKSSWVWKAKPIYESARVRIVPVAGIGIEKVGRVP